MNTKVKVGIAAAIVASLVALIVLDQKTTPKEDAARPAPGADSSSFGGTTADAPSHRMTEEEANTLYFKEAEKRFAQPSAKPPVGIKGAEEKNEKKIPSATGEEYVIKEGDTFDTIAKARFGSSSYASKIAEANPSLKATALRVGKTIVIPAKPASSEKKEEAPVAAQETLPSPRAPMVQKDPVQPKKAAESALVTVDGKRIYTVQPGDTLSGISVKVYNTSRHSKKIFEANQEQIDDPNILQVGSKLVMPDLPSKPAAANGATAGTVATTNPAPIPAPAGAKVVQVVDKDSLWKIAEKFASERKIGVHDMMRLIVGANPDKLKDESTLLRLGWQLIIPE